MIFMSPRIIKAVKSQRWLAVYTAQMWKERNGCRDLVGAFLQSDHLSAQE